jgi:hypothetical protein
VLPLLSASTVGPEGLDIRTTSSHHILSRLNLKCVRAELFPQKGDGSTFPVEEAWAQMRCVGADVFIPAGTMAGVRVSYPPEDLGSLLWVRPCSGAEGVRGGFGDDDCSPSQLCVVEGPIAIPEDGDGSLEVYVRAPDDADVLVEPGAAVCVFTSAAGLEAELSSALDAEEIQEVRFEGNPPRAWSPDQLQQFYQELVSREPSADVDLVWHLASLANVFWIAAEGGLSFKHTKSQLLQHSLKLLGTITGRDGLAPDPEKIKALQLFPPPRTKGQLREFFGTINWLRPFWARNLLLQVLACDAI